MWNCKRRVQPPDDDHIDVQHDDASMFMMMIQKVVIGKDGKVYLEKAGFWRRGCAKRIIRNIAGIISLL